MRTRLQLIPLLEPIRSEMEGVERLLHETLSEVEDPLGSMLRPLLSGGKRLRSALVILVGRMFNRSAAPFCTLAAAIEMLHSATLIHDDLMDNAPLRRGCRTLHTTWPAAATVLAGDYLLARSVSLVAELNLSRLVRIFAHTLCTICAGEIRQTSIPRGESRPRQDYYQSIEAKAASLFAACAEMAAILSGAQESQIGALRNYGHQLGTAFQVVDDVLDFTGTEARLGKPAGSDLRQGLITLPTLLYLENAGDDTAVNAVLSGQREEGLVATAVQAIRTSGAIEASLAEAQTHGTQSQRALVTLPDNASRHALFSLAEFVVARTH